MKMNEPQEIPQVFAKIVELCEALGVSNIKELPGCWKHRIDDQWKIWVNGHDRPITIRWPGVIRDKVEIPPFHAYIEFEGWPAGLVSPKGGTMVAGRVAHKDTFIEALDRAIKEAKNEQRSAPDPLGLPMKICENCGDRAYFLTKKGFCITCAIVKEGLRYVEREIAEKDAEITNLRLELENRAGIGEQ